MCSALIPDCGYNKSTFIFIWGSVMSKYKVFGQTLRAQKDFSISRQKRLSMSALRVCLPGAQDSLCISIKLLFLSFGQEVHVFEESPKSDQGVIEDVNCLGKYFVNRGKCESLDNYTTTVRSNYCCGTCGPRLLVEEVPFLLQEHVKTTKTN